jgi:hypothetical protein
VIPVGSTITMAELELYNHSASNTCWIDTGAFKMLVPWDVADANWIQATANTNWGSAGCSLADTDHATDPVGTQFVDATGEWYAFTITQLAQEWVAQPSANHGVTLRAVNSQCEVARGYPSSNAGNTALRPRLVITYIEP